MMMVMVLRIPRVSSVPESPLCQGDASKEVRARSPPSRCEIDTLSSSDRGLASLRLLKRLLTSVADENTTCLRWSAGKDVRFPLVGGNEAVIVEHRLLERACVWAVFQESYDPPQDSIICGVFPGTTSSDASVFACLMAACAARHASTHSLRCVIISGLGRLLILMALRTSGVSQDFLRLSGFTFPEVFLTFMTAGCWVAAV